MPAPRALRCSGIRVVIHHYPTGAAENGRGIDRHGPKLVVSEFRMAARTSKELLAGRALIRHHIHGRMPMLAAPLPVNRTVNPHGPRLRKCRGFHPWRHRKAMQNPAHHGGSTQRSTHRGEPAPPCADRTVGNTGEHPVQQQLPGAARFHPPSAGRCWDENEALPR